MSDPRPYGMNRMVTSWGTPQNPQKRGPQDVGVFGGFWGHFGPKMAKGAAPRAVASLPQTGSPGPTIRAKRPPSGAFPAPRGLKSPWELFLVPKTAPRA